LNGIAAIGSGSDHVCAVHSTGAMYCWGRNLFGQLGLGTATAYVNVPSQVVGPGGIGTFTGAEQVDTGTHHTCATKTDGTVWCWGWDNHGSNGDGGGQNQSNNPVQVTGVGGSGTLSNATVPAVGGYHSCALRSDSTITCWGSGTDGQLGNATSVDSDVPALVTFS
jgi:alpha-tubulin suppressor-like RCC1 family protein